MEEGSIGRFLGLKYVLVLGVFGDGESSKRSNSKMSA